jgi:hypothetical protein
MNSLRHGGVTYTAEEIDAWNYALAKPLPTAHTLETSYGSLALDAQMQRAVLRALQPILMVRIAAVGGRGR